MQKSCNKFEAFVVSLSELPLFCRHQLPPLPNPADPGPRTQCVQQLLDVSWRVQHSPPDGHFELLPSPLWHSVAWRYFDNSPFPTHATMNAHVFDRVVLQDPSHLISVVLPRWTAFCSMSSSSPIRMVFQFKLLQQEFLQLQSDLLVVPVNSKSSTCTQKKTSRVSCWNTSGQVTDSLTLGSSSCFHRDGPAKSSARCGFHTWARSKMQTYRPDAATGFSGGNSTYNDLLASPHKKSLDICQHD